jgi:fermentation-respiration switch protein FrsA (DUF1100 family)
LGGAAALLAAPLKVDALVIESVYPTIAEALHDRIAMRLGVASYLLTPVLTCQLQPRLGIAPAELRPIDHIANVDCPILVVGGDLDEHTPLIETRRMFETAVEPKQLLIVPGAHHTDLHDYDPVLYREKILSFLQVHLDSSSPKD